MKEVYYTTLREAGQELADAIAQLISTLPIQIVPVDLELTKQAAEFKAFKRMSYGDYFATVLAKLKKAELVTGNEEFKQIANKIKIFWVSQYDILNFNKDISKELEAN